MDQPIQVQEKAPQPQGLLPKNVQSWLLVGLAFLMIAIMWLTGGKKTPAPAAGPGSCAGWVRGWGAGGTPPGVPG